MFQSYRIALWMAVLVLAVIVGGCKPPAPQEKQQSTTPTKTSTQATDTTPAGNEGHEHAEAAGNGAPEGLAELSDDDRAAAEKQRVCPVSGDVLGAMGKPYKVSVKGQTVFLCCTACEKELMKNPDKYLAKIRAGKPE